MFELDNLTYCYPGQEVRILDSITASFNSGEFVVVQGPSGVGKSTLLYLIGMLLNEGALVGSIRFENEQLSSYSERKKSEIRKSRFGFLTQSSFLIPSMTCRENVALPLLVQGYSRRSAFQIVHSLVKEADEVCKVKQDQRNLGLSHKLEHYPSEISGGQRKRLALLRSIIHSPEVLFADEPLSNLDAATRIKIVILLQKWKEGELLSCPPRDNTKRTVIVVSHEDDLQNCANKIVVFNENGGATQKTRNQYL